MKSYSAAIALAALSTQVAAFPQLAELTVEKRQDPNAWIAPGPGDVRAPCPGMNTLANHGFIPRNGQGITAQALQQGFLDAFGMGFDNTNAGANNAINQCTAITGNDCTVGGFNLDQMNEPHAIEHDGSMTRMDAGEADGTTDNHDFSMVAWQASLDAFGSCTTHVDINLSSQVRQTRNNEAQASDNAGWFQLNEGGELAEQSFMLTTMNDPVVGTDPANPQARLDWISYWFENQRLPTAIGWVKPAASISGPQLNAVQNAIQNAPGTVANCPATNAPPAPTGGNAPPAPTGGNAPFSTMVPYGNSSTTCTDEYSPYTTIKPSTPAQTSVSDKKSAAAVATSKVGPAPSAPNAYATVLKPEQWSSYIKDAKVYAVKVEYVAQSVLSKAGYTAASTVPSITVIPVSTSTTSMASKDVKSTVMSTLNVQSAVATPSTGSYVSPAATKASTYTGGASFPTAMANLAIAGAGLAAAVML